MKGFLDSLNKNKKAIMLMVISSLLTSFGQLSWKLSLNKNIIALILVGFFLYGLGAFIMIIAYKFGELSVVQPMMCIGYIFALINGYFFLQEKVSILQAVGIVLIIVGVLYIGGASRDE